MKGNIGLKGVTVADKGAFYAPNIPTKVPQTWQSYLRRLGNGINGVSDRSENVTDADIVARAEKYMQIKYPGPYRVEQYYNSDKMKWDLRLKFANPKEETFWLLKYSA